MIVQTENRWYQKQEMLAAAARQGFTASGDMFDDWIEKGLLGEAGKRERPGRGSYAWWSQAQLDLFLRLLAHRQREQNKIHLGPLCNIPVCAWFYCGELSGITRNQVKRAMKTWMDYQRKIPEEQLRRSVTQLVHRYQGEHATGKRSLIDELTDIGTLSKDADPEVLQFLLDPVINARSKKKREKGPSQEPFKPVDYLSDVFSYRFQALQMNDTLLDVADSIWQWARTANLVALARYMHEQPTLAADPKLGDQFERATFKTLCEQSCTYLLTLLGIAHQQASVSTYPNDWQILHPKSWLAGKATSIIQTQVVYSQLVFPNGQPIRYIRNEIILSYQGTQQRFAFDLSYI